MRERLIELLMQGEREAENEGFFNCHKSKKKAEYIADHLLENGVIVLPCKIGDTVYRINSVLIPEYEDGVITEIREHTKVVESTLQRSDIAINEVYLSREEAEKFSKLPQQARDLHRIRI